MSLTRVKTYDTLVASPGSLAGAAKTGETGRTAALYIHIPFCEKRCNYCDFYTVAHREQAIPRYLQALQREMQLYSRHPFWKKQTFSTIFFGGGTPSLLSPRQVAELLSGVHAGFAFVEPAEITMEMNPGTVREEDIHGYFRAGVNRLSLGVQSFWPEELVQLDRMHRIEEVENTVAWARQAGFKNLSLDLIFALPGQRPSRWKYTLQKALSLEPEHLSCYNLTIEPGTPLAKRIEAGKIKPLSECKERVLYGFTMDYLEAHGYPHYEVSNYAKPGYACRHNIKYWDGSAYLGLGASAHSFDGAKRFWNVANYVSYCEALEKGRWPVADEEILSESQKRFEMIFLGLRRKEGVSLPQFHRRFQASLLREYAPHLEKLLCHRPPLVMIDGDHLRLTREGWLLCDAVCAEFLD